MSRRVAQRRLSAVRGAMGSVAALAAGLVLVAGTAGTAAAIPADGGARAGAVGCGSDQEAKQPSAAAAAAARAATAEPPAAATGTAAEKISYSLPSQLPIGMWSRSGVTLRTPVTKGTVRLDVRSRGFGTDSLAVQRYVPKTHKWTDLKSRSTGSDTHGVFTFPVTADASAAHPHSVALRIQDLDRPGTLTVTASVDDGKGRTHRAHARTAATTRPDVSVTGWRSGDRLSRGGAPSAPFTVTVKNTTDRPYPALYASYFAYGAGKSHALAPKDLVLQQYRPGHGWERVPLVAGGCDPGMSAALLPVVKGPLAPGATASYRLRIAVAGTAPRDVPRADAGVTVGNGDLSFHHQELPFAIR
ncbi:hypothetical protein AB0L26_11360 [Streptomyces nondiastaticus]|uniref:hypothetical protein n=1 Tax=Streptomyces nondiastaticus TaxID=3154512 RepID=UPI00343BD19C